MRPLEQLLESWSRVRGWYPVTMAGRQYHCDPNHISFWSRVSRGDWEPETFQILDRLIRPGSIYCDIGAWIGPTVLYAAQKSRRIYCIEPDRIAYMYLLQNIKLNHIENVLPFNIALAGKNELRRMASPRGKRGDSMTSLLNPDGKRGVEVLCLEWQTWLSHVGNPKIDCMKMDIEGGEFALLPVMADYLKKYRPALYLSLHPHLLPKSERAEAMSQLVQVLEVYGSCYTRVGREDVGVETLMEEQAVNRAGSYLLLP